MNTVERSIEGIYPLSPMQEGMLFHALLTPAAGMYVSQYLYRLEGDLATEAFEEAWRVVARRHGVMRTAFFWEELGSPHQVVFRDVVLPFRRVDWRGLSAAEREARMERLLEEDRQEGFEPEKVPLMRLVLVRTENTRHELLWSFHHLLFDGWCLPRVLREVLEAYAVCRRGGEPPVGEAASFESYIAWLKKQDVSAAEGFWRELLAGFTERTPVGLEEPVTAAGEDAGAGFESALLDAAHCRALEALARRCRVTQNTLLQGAWGLLLSRYSGRRDVVFGNVVSGRPADLPGADEMVGLFINTLPVRVRVEPGEHLGAWLREIQEQQIQARRYEFTPLVQIQEWSEIPAGTPLFESLLSFESNPEEASPDTGADELAMNYVASRVRTNFPLDLVTGPGEAWSLVLSFERRSIDEVVAKRILGHLRTLLSVMGQGEKQRLDGLEILTAGERRQILDTWCATDYGEMRDVSVLEVFEARMREEPDRTALIFGVGGETWSYERLYRRAREVAAALGPRPAESAVAVLAHRGPEWVAAVLGTWMRGLVYLPLEPGHPPKRLAVSLGQSGAAVLLVGAGLGEVAARALSELSAAVAPDVVELDTIRGTVALPAIFSPDSGKGAEAALAYVIFTSGSTGAPKGAMVEHRGMVNHLLAKIEDLDLVAEDRVAQTASPSFDISVWQMLAPLLVGASVRIYDDEVTHDPERLLASAAADRVTVLETVPSLLAVALEVLPEAIELDRLRWMMVTGEALSPPLCRRWLERFPEVPLVNAYGPTECSDDVTHAFLDRREQASRQRLPIGKPLANTRLHVLDREGRLQPVGASGELFVGGLGVGRGYLRAPSLTAERFVPDPFSADPGQRLYRTGDRVRWVPDGQLEFLGRLDRQVKVRGHRIELEEIRETLCRHPGVRQAAVVLKTRGTHGEVALAAYVVASGADEQELRTFLRGELPEAMVPERIAFLEDLPRNVAGKVDLGALPQPDWSTSEADEAPRTPIERQVASLWAEVLGLEEVGLRRSFFELGGHSLKATQLLARLRRTFDLALPLRLIFDQPTVEGIALAIMEEQMSELGGEEVTEILAEVQGTTLGEGAGEPFGGSSE